MPEGPGDMASILADDAIVAAMVPWPCPCDFGAGDRYQLEELVGAGRESLIYRATDRRLSSEGFAARVAIKIAPADGGRLRLDALSGRRISHPNVLAVLDHGATEEGVAYVVAEYVDGGDLTRRPGPWPKREAAAFIAKLARGVQAAHAAGVVHCDLKPANILLTAEGEPKLGDFDLCRALNDGDDGPGGVGARGNFAFMAPEQLSGDASALTPPADIYALGGLLFWLLTGRCANGETHEEIRGALGAGGESGDAPARHPPRARAERDLDLICARAMAARPEDRYHSAGELADDLQRWSRHEPIPGTRPSVLRRIGLWRRRHPTGALLVVFLAVVAGAALGFWLYTVEQARVRELEARQQQIEAQRAALEEADRKLRNVKERVLVQLDMLLQLASAGDSEGIYDRVLPALVWLEWAMDSPVLPDEARIPFTQERIKALRMMLPHSSPGVGPARVEHLLALYSLAYFLIEEGGGAEPAALLRELREGWGGRLDPADPFLKGVAILEHLAAANEAAARGEAPEVIAGHLDAASRRLLIGGDQTSVGRLFVRVKGRLQRPEGGAGATPAAKAEPKPLGAPPG